jgi:two-component system sensor histidine kinase KdpD
MFVRAALAASLFPAAVTVLALVPDRVPQMSVALAYVLAVAGAATIGGLGAGLGASLVSFLALNFFFTPPRGTFAIDKSEDLVALGVYLVVSSLVGVLLSRALSQRARAQRREQETLLLNRVGNELLRGKPIDDVLRNFATSLVDLFDLSTCEIVTDVTSSIVVQSDASGDGAEATVVPMRAGREELGHIAVTPRLSRPPLNALELDMVRSFASQAALALSGVRAP